MPPHGKKGFLNRVKDLDSINFEHFSNPWNFFSLFLQDRKTIVTWLRNHKLLAATMQCETCASLGFENVEMKIGSRVSHIDGETWRCTKNRNHEAAIRKFSVFNNAHLTFQDILIFFICFIEKNSLLRSAVKSGLSYKSTAVEWGCLCRKLCIDFVHRTIINDENPLKIAGEIEIDESLFGRRVKYHRGKPQGLQVFS